MTLKVLMFGWEFPPYKSGGLGTACYDLTKGMARQGVEVTFVMPVAPKNAKEEFVKLRSADKLTKANKKVNVKTITTPISAYITTLSYEQAYTSLSESEIKGTKKGGYGKDLFSEVERYASIAGQIAEEVEHDIIHAHDWMTYKAAINAQKISGKPIVVHIHATEFDRTGGNPHPHISQIEFEGMNHANKVIANSGFTKNNVMKHYAIEESKIDVVHWGIDENLGSNIEYETPLKARDKIVLFLGRVTIQKGPDYFVEMAKEVLRYEPYTTFVLAGDGDMLPRVINRAAELGIAHKFVFTGNLRGDDVHKAFKTADLYVMPSVSEPFGLVALESLKNGTPILISNQSGVSEVVNHALKTDFWDIKEMTNMIVNVLKHGALRKELKEQGCKEVKKFNLDEPAKKVINTYHNVLREDSK